MTYLHGVSNGDGDGDASNRLAFMIETLSLLPPKDCIVILMPKKTFKIGLSFRFILHLNMKIV